LKNMIAGEPLDASSREMFAMDLNKQFGEGAAQFQGAHRVRVDTPAGGLIFDARTKRVILAEGKQLQSLIGGTVSDACQKVSAMKHNGWDQALDVDGVKRTGKRVKTQVENAWRDVRKKSDEGGKRVNKTVSGVMEKTLSFFERTRTKIGDVTQKQTKDVARNVGAM